MRPVAPGGKGVTAAPAAGNGAGAVTASHLQVAGSEELAFFPVGQVGVIACFSVVPDFVHSVGPDCWVPAGHLNSQASAPVGFGLHLQLSGSLGADGVLFTGQVPIILAAPPAPDEH